jgi:hypothetical protein
MNESDEFYIGWEGKSPPGIATAIRRVVFALLTFAPVLAVGLALAQRTIGIAFFEWRTTRTFRGILQQKPYPHLLVAQPGGGELAAYYLVAPYKFGLKTEVPAGEVSLRGKLIYRDNQTMIEVERDSIRPLAEPIGEIPDTVEIGRFKLTGEIVDSKCFLGVMNPGQLTPHRACAVRCISGGIPPVLLVRQFNEPPLYFLLVGLEGQPVNQQVLDMVAVPVEITGVVSRKGNLLILRADPATYRRL